ncbi:hypothetical protein [Opitutus sp. GAS368]|jgi:hypothetical protein|uniref:hypothetical protein n=1 Tax=Opitutus sp. GAS368 TaxID=1882749 RepID=UPI00087DC3B5|nr:hypothetical protein [Opitutus sp. GAS368]SDR65368.1 hypothetical protein SAMN05444173_0040 [Opitutus sp. GAS368]
MKNLARFAPVAAVLGTVLFFSGCATPRSARVTRARPVAEFTVVESSTQKELTPAQLGELREAVANYLHEQGLTSNRRYYVKISFPGENPGDEEQWAIVRIGSLPTRTYTILAAYPGPDDYDPYDYYGYNAGYDGLARYGYYDPFDYNYGYYTRPAPRRDHKPDDRPGDKPDHPRTVPTRWDNKRPDPDQPRWRDRDHPDNPNPRNGARNHPDDGGRKRDGGGSRDGGRDRPASPGGGSTAPRPAYTPPAPVRSDPPARSESSSQNRDDRRPTTVNDH